MHVAHQIESVRVGKADVEEHDVGCEPPAQLDSATTGVGVADDGEPFELEEFGRLGAEPCVVVDDHNTEAHADNHGPGTGRRVIRATTQLK